MDCHRFSGFEFCLKLMVRLFGAGIRIGRMNDISFIALSVDGVGILDHNFPIRTLGVVSDLTFYVREFAGCRWPALCRDALNDFSHACNGQPCAHKDEKRTERDDEYEHGFVHGMGLVGKRNNEYVG